MDDKIVVWECKSGMMRGSKWEIDLKAREVVIFLNLIDEQDCDSDCGVFDLEDYIKAIQNLKKEGRAILIGRTNCQYVQDMRERRIEFIYNPQKEEVRVVLNLGQVSACVDLDAKTLFEKLP